MDDILQILKEGRDVIDAFQAMTADGKVEAHEVVQLARQINEVLTALLNAVERILAGETPG